MYVILFLYYLQVSDLNAEAKQFIPPFDRYRKYRSLAQVHTVTVIQHVHEHFLVSCFKYQCKQTDTFSQIEEIKEYKDKEAKIAAIGKGNELIKSEVLVKLQQAKSHIENEEKINNAHTVVTIGIDETEKKMTQRKRKMSTEKVEPGVEEKESVETATEQKEIDTDSKSKVNIVEPFAYKDVDYNKFHTDSNKDRKQKQPKMKYKKHKK